MAIAGKKGQRAKGSGFALGQVFDSINSIGTPLQQLRAEKTAYDQDQLNQYIIENNGGPFISEEDILLYLEDLETVSYSKKEKIASLAIRMFHQKLKQ